MHQSTSVNFGEDGTGSAPDRPGPFHVKAVGGGAPGPVLRSSKVFAPYNTTVTVADDLYGNFDNVFQERSCFTFPAYSRMHRKAPPLSQISGPSPPGKRPQYAAGPKPDLLSTCSIVNVFRFSRNWPRHGVVIH